MDLKPWRSREWCPNVSLRSNARLRTMLVPTLLTNGPGRLHATASPTSNMVVVWHVSNPAVRCGCFVLSFVESRVPPFNLLGDSCVLRVLDFVGFDLIAYGRYHSFGSSVALVAVSL